MTLIEDVSQAAKNKTARFAGLLLLFSLIIPTLNWIFIFSKFIAPDNYLSTSQNILNNTFIFRLGITNEILTAVVIILLALTLYELLKPTSRNLALIATVLLMVDAFITIVIALGHLVLIQILSDNVEVAMLNSEQLKTFAGLFLNMHVALTSIPGMFLGLSMFMFSYLFLNLKYIPNVLAAFGLVSCFLVFIYDLLFVLSPHYSSISFIQTIGLAPYVLFTLIIGVWLLIKGISIQKV